jgi:hypothetical protein
MTCAQRLAIVLNVGQPTQDPNDVEKQIPAGESKGQIKGLPGSGSVGDRIFGISVFAAVLLGRDETILS